MNTIYKKLKTLLSFPLFMKSIKGILLLGTTLLIASCFLSGGNSQPDVREIIHASELEKEARESEERYRPKSSSSRNRGSCDNCNKICEDIYDFEDRSRNDGKVERCLDLSTSTIKDLEELVDHLSDENVTARDLNDLVDADDFKEYLSISLNSWIDITEGASEEGSKVLLAWIADHSTDNNLDSHSDSPAQALKKAHEDAPEGYSQYQGIKNLLQNALTEQDRELKICNTKIGKHIGNNSCLDYAVGICQSELLSDKTFNDLASTNTNTNTIGDEILKECSDDIDNKVGESGKIREAFDTLVTSEACEPNPPSCP